MVAYNKDKRTWGTIYRSHGIAGIYGLLRHFL